MSAPNVQSADHGAQLRQRVLDLGRRYSLGMHELVTTLADFDLSGEWALDNERTCAHWVAKRCDVETCTAREWLRIGHALRELPEIARRFEAGELSYSKVRILTRIATPDNEAILCDLADSNPASNLAEAIANWLGDTESDDERERRELASRSVRYWVEPDGMVCIKAKLPVVAARKVMAAIDAQVVRAQSEKRVRPDASATQGAFKWPSLAQQRADAFVAVVLGGASVDTELVLHVRGDGATFDDGTPIAESWIAKLLPESLVRVLIHDAEGRPINASGRRRFPTTRQKRIVKERDRCCVDCGSTTLLQYDHDPPFATTKRTVVEELRLRCASCHHKRFGHTKPPD